MSIIDKYFPKKLKLRIVHYVWDHYKIQYSYYRFIPLFHDISVFSYDVADSSDFSNGWVPLADYYGGAIHRAKDFETIDKIRKFQKEMKLHAAQPKQFSLEDMNKAINEGFQMARNQSQGDFPEKEYIEEYIQSLSTQQLPKEFFRRRCCY